jgi:hypothetical protein
VPSVVKINMNFEKEPSSNSEPKRKKRMNDRQRCIFTASKNELRLNDFGFRKLLTNF